MDKVRLKLVRYAVLAVFLLLCVMVLAINAANFTMAAEDADGITARIAQGKGFVGPENFMPEMPGGNNGNMPGGFFFLPMGPDSPEMGESLRYFTVRLTDEGGEFVAFELAAMDRDEALGLAREVSTKSVGWVRGAYRFRVFKDKGETFVTVVDQSRELYPSYRILWISIAVAAAGLVISAVFLVWVSKQLFRPLEKADRGQRQFLAEAENAFKVPLTIIQANAELLEKEHGASDYTTAIRRQAGKMNALVRQLGSYALYEKPEKEKVDLSALVRETMEAQKDAFAEKGLELKLNVQDGITLEGDEKSLLRALKEMADNSLRYGRRYASFTLTRDRERITFVQENGADLEDGNLDQVFDRFATLGEDHGQGMGLAYVKDVIKAHNGRLKARAAGGAFILEISL